MGALSYWFTPKKIIFSIFTILFIGFYYGSFFGNLPKYDIYSTKLIPFTETLSKVPKKVLDAKLNIKTYDSFIHVKVKRKTVLTKIVEAKPLEKWKYTFVFLHGMSFTSKNWVEIESLHLVAALGHRAIAVDLPGWGGSGEKLKEYEMNSSDYLEALFTALDVKTPILVTPSMSGAYSIPFMMEPNPETCHKRLFGIITIAPIKTDLYTHSQYYRCQIPSMLVLGSLDQNIGLQAMGNLRNMPHKLMYIIRGAGHPAYIEQPAEWNKLLYHFSKFVLLT